MARDFQTAGDGFAITPGPNLLPRTADAIYVGVAGTVVIETPAGTSLSFVAVAGSIIPFRAVKVTSGPASLIGALQYA